MDNVGFKIGRKGVLFLLRENGSRQKCGLRVRDERIEVFERRTATWHVLPELLTSNDGSVTTLVVLTE